MKTRFAPENGDPYTNVYRLPGHLGVAMDTRTEHDRHLNDSDRKSIVTAIADCACTGCAVLGQRVLDLRPVLSRADQILCHLPIAGTGYWQVDAYLNKTGTGIALLLGDGGLPVGGHGPTLEYFRLSSAPAESLADWPMAEPPGVYACQSDGGRIVVLRVSGEPVPGPAADRGAALSAFGRWLNGLRVPGAGHPAGAVPAVLDAEQQAAVQQAELVVAFDPAAGHGGWFRRVRRPSATAPGGRAHWRPGPRGPRTPEPTPAGGQKPPDRVGPSLHETAAPASTGAALSDSNGAGASGVNGPGADATVPNGTYQETVLARRLRTSANPPDLLDTLRSSLRATDSRYPGRAKLAKLSPDERLAKLGTLPKSPGQAWLIAAAAADRDPFAPGPVWLRTVRVVDIPGRGGQQDTAPSAPSAEGEVGQVVYLVDGAVFDELIYLVLGPAGPQGAYARYIEVIKIVIEPRLIVIKVVTMSAGLILHAHGLGALAPAAGRILTRITSGMLTAILGPGRFRRAESLLDWINMIAAARAGQLSDSATFRTKLSDLLNRRWNGTPRSRSGTSYPRPDAPVDDAPAAGPPPNSDPPPKPPSSGGSPPPDDPDLPPPGGSTWAQPVPRPAPSDPGPHSKDPSAPAASDPSRSANVGQAWIVRPAGGADREPTAPANVDQKAGLSSAATRCAAEDLPRQPTARSTSAISPRDAPNPDRPPAPDRVARSDSDQREVPAAGDSTRSLQPGTTAGSLRQPPSLTDAGIRHSLIERSPDRPASRNDPAQPPEPPGDRWAVSARRQDQSPDLLPKPTGPPGPRPADHDAVPDPSMRPGTSMSGGALRPGPTRKVGQRYPSNELGTARSRPAGERQASGEPSSPSRRETTRSRWDDLWSARSAEDLSDEEVSLRRKAADEHERDSGPRMGSRPPRLPSERRQRDQESGRIADTRFITSRPIPPRSGRPANPAETDPPSRNVPPRRDPPSRGGPGMSR